MNSNAVLERHPELYFSDGDIVLAVKQADSPPQWSEYPAKYTLFRVHKFLLKHHSAPFANFLADANAAPAEIYDGVPLAEMHGDRAEDFALLLNYLYNPSSLVSKRNDPNTPLTVSGAVRLADKYLIEPLHRCLVQQVIDDWPVTLDEYDVKQGEIESLRLVAVTNDNFKYTPYGGRLSDVIPEPASAILFAQEFGCPQILRAAYYRLSLIPVSSDWSSTAQHDAVARWSILDKDSLLRCMHGSQEITRYRPPVFAFMADPCIEEFYVHGETGSPCYEFIARLFDIVFDQIHPMTRPDPLRFLTKCLDFYKMSELSKEEFPDGLCVDCEETLREELVSERKKVWAMLPRWFKLE
ncbi:hypothetical protein GSI_08666 [Ganoderma sinense ZZ0214-1]|uniref:BTB domain-containing protein n=1 Tax=Ganoderma sinense ZZ0214-1 TaxID=1077348 RepID=A0A2G8S4G7_9APHY|nr:hypothetical protein GSI_08666 [Ganoderma sinense ZZ0214-1]